MIRNANDYHNYMMDR